jgi:hypothetical protein
MPPSFQNMGKEIFTKPVKAIAETFIPEYIKSNEEQDVILKSINALPEKISEQSLLLSMNLDIQKAMLANKQTQEGENPKSFLIDNWGVLDSTTQREVSRGITYSTLRSMSEQCEIVAAIINTRLNQVASFAKIPRSRYSMGFRIEKVGGGEMTEYEQREARKHEQFILNCGEGSAAHKRDYFEGFLKKVVRDSFVYDQLNYERIFTRGGQLHEVVAVDAASIRHALRKFLDTPNKNRDGSDNYVPSDRGPGGSRSVVPLNQKAFIQVIHGQIQNEYTEDEMAFDVFFPRTDLRNFGYGYSPVEQLIQTVTAILYASEYNRRFFSSGSSPKGVLNVKGNMSMSSLESFKKGWLAQLTGLSGSWRTPIVAAENGLEFINMQQTNREMEFAKYMDFLVKVAAAVFQMAPEEINFTSQSTAGSSGNVFESKGELKLKASRDKGLVPLLTFIENSINRGIMRYRNPNYEFVLVGLDGGTEADKVALDKEKLATFSTINEVRKEHGLKPLKKHGDIVLSPQFIAAYVADLTAKHQEEAAKQQNDMTLEQQDSQVEAEEKSTKTQMEAQKLQMKHDEMKMGHDTQRHEMMKEKASLMPKEGTNKPKPKKVIKKSFDAAGNVVDNLVEEEYDEEDWTEFENEIQKAIKTGEIKDVLKSLKDNPVVLNLNLD